MPLLSSRVVSQSPILRMFDVLKATRALACTNRRICHRKRLGRLADIPIEQHRTLLAQQLPPVRVGTRQTQNRASISIKTRLFTLLPLAAARGGTGAMTFSDHQS